LKSTNLDVTVGDRPNFKAWLARMEALEGYDSIHVLLAKMAAANARKRTANL